MSNGREAFTFNWTQTQSRHKNDNLKNEKNIYCSNVYFNNLILPIDGCQFMDLIRVFSHWFWRKVRDVSQI